MSCEERPAQEQRDPQTHPPEDDSDSVSVLALNDRPKYCWLHYPSLSVKRYPQEPLYCCQEKKTKIHTMPKNRAYLRGQVCRE